MSRLDLIISRRRLRVLTLVLACVPFGGELAGLALAAPPDDTDADADADPVPDPDAASDPDSDADIAADPMPSDDDEGDADVDVDAPVEDAPAEEAEAEADAEAPEAAAEPEPAPDPNHINDFTLSGGGLLTTGNANTLAASGKAAATVRRGKHQFTGGFDGNYGRSRANPRAEWLPTAANMEGRARYDGFFVDWASGFVASTARHDPFQGLTVRWTLDPGVTFYAVQKERHTLKFDVGYQLQVDGRRRGAIVLKDADGLVILDDLGQASRDPELDPVFVNHSARLAANYELKVNDSVKWRLGTEYIQSFMFREEADRWRINGETGLDVSLVAGLGLGFSLQVRYDNKPLPDVKKLDTFSNVTLTYTFKAAKKKD